MMSFSKMIRGIKGGAAVLAAASMMLLFGFGASAQSRIAITGTITDGATGEPLAGAVVIEKGTTNGSETNIDGKYSISVNPKAALEVSFIGYATKTVSVGSSNVINIVLEPDGEFLEETVVIGYGTAKKSDLTGAIATVKAENLIKEAPRSVQDLLRANAAGLQIGMSNNAEGTASLQVRGKNTLTAGSSPLIVVDGVIFNGSLSDINPVDVESIDVLKDASSVAVFGAKAASGVVAIVTNKGMKGSGKPTIGFNANMGVVHAANLTPLLSPEKFLQMRSDYYGSLLTEDEYFNTKKEIYKNPSSLTIDKLTWYNYDQKVPVTEVPDDKTLTTTWLSRIGLKQNEIDNYFSNTITDWDDIIFQNGLQQDYTASIANRTDRSSYYWSLGYAKREGILTGDYFETYRSRVNLEGKATKWLTLGMNASFSVKDNSAQETDSDGVMLCADVSQRENNSPYASNDINDPDSQYMAFPNGDNNNIHPMYMSTMADKREMKYVLNSSLYAKINLPFGFEFKTSFSPYFRWDQKYWHISSDHVDYGGVNGKSTRINKQWYNWQIDNILSWKKEFGNHRFEFTALQNAEKNQYWSNNIISKEYEPTDVLGYHRVEAGNYNEVSSNDTYSTGDALMARLFYSYANKYMVTASVRRDGYSAFGINNPRATFPAIALGWTFTNEEFMKGAGNWLNFGKLRLSWGENGNRDIGQYAALAQLTFSKHMYIDAETGTPMPSTQIYINKMANNDLKWERTQAYNLGLDFALFDNRISGSVEGYISETNDLLVSRSLPKLTGYTSITANLGKLGNKGFEMTLNADVIKTRDLLWESGLTFSFNRRKIISLYGDYEDILDAEGNVIGKKEKDDPSNSWFIGRDPDQIWAYESAGVWQADEADEAKKFGLKPGDLKYVDQLTVDSDGDGILDSGDGVLNDKDKVFQGYTTPRFYLSWRNQVSWKRLTFSMMMYARLGHYGTFNRAANGSSMLERRTYIDQPYWTWENPSNFWGRLGSNNKGSFYLNKSFVRMESISVSYDLPKKVCKAISASACDVAFSLRNPFVVSGWKVGDPEGGDYTMQTANFSIRLTF